MSFYELVSLLFLLCDDSTTPSNKISCNQKMIECVKQYDGSISYKDILWKCAK